MSPVTFAYYCSGHGYGHATRVSAFATHLLSLDQGHIVYIISSAPARVFADSIAAGAQYRTADIDPIIVQPLAYRVDRKGSVDVLQRFMESKDYMLEVEVQWLRENEIDCVLSDAAFLGCLAANHASIPSVLITNFSFDSVYSYLATTLFDQSKQASESSLSVPDLGHHLTEHLAPDMPISPDVLEPLVNQIVAGYRCADLLLLLPGAIPIPSFPLQPSLPSTSWIDPITLTFSADVADNLIALLEHPNSVHLSTSCNLAANLSTRRKIVDCTRTRPRKVIPTPLLVRPPSSAPSHSPYTHKGRTRLLTSMGVPERLHNSRILLVSFGGQVFKPPRSRSRSRERVSSHQVPIETTLRESPYAVVDSKNPSSALITPPASVDSYFPSLETLKPTPIPSSEGTPLASPPLRPTTRAERPTPHRLASVSHIFVPGAPPARSLPSTPLLGDAPTFVTNTIPATPMLDRTLMQFTKETTLSLTNGVLPPNAFEETKEDIPELLPDGSWIAIVCGVSSDWGRDGEHHGLPDGFYVAPRDTYMPDLTAAADVLLGKLGYGTVAECVDACTPFVYVSRPLFVEEHGLRLLLDRDGVGVELARVDYEEGNWAQAVREAWKRGQDAKALKRALEHDAIEREIMHRSKSADHGVSFPKVGGAAKREQEGRELAGTLVQWVDEWWHAAGCE